MEEQQIIIRSIDKYMLANHVRVSEVKERDTLMELGKGSTLIEWSEKRWHLS